ncbi:MAG: esterase/lipase family protein [Myxococcota bacterium]
MTDRTCHVYLVPGFFGFQSFGAFDYFQRVADVLREQLEARGLYPRVIECSTQPTGSIRNRADRVLQQVLESGGDEADELHFVGHSTGGLDVRMLLTPGVVLRGRRLESDVAQRARTAVTVATPHHGTPLANYFTSMQGRQLLELLATLSASTQGRHLLFLTARITELAARMDDRLGRDRTFLDELSDRLLRHLTLDRDDPVWAYLEEVASDQGAVIQITPEGMHLFNAAVTDRQSIRYGSVLTAAPGSFAHRPTDVLHPRKLATATLFALLHQLAGREHRHYPYPPLPSHFAEAVREQLPFEVDRRTNDGVVPTCSQAHGEVVDVVVSDHLDVVGQYEGAVPGRMSDWLPSASRFDTRRFRQVWTRVAEFIAASSG